MEKTLLATDLFSEILKQKNEKVTARAKAYIFRYYTISTISVLERGFSAPR